MRIRDPGSGMETVRIRDSGWKKVGSGIRDKHPGSAILLKILHILFYHKFSQTIFTLASARFLLLYNTIRLSKK
jgi:hypothetical protein